MGEEKFLFRNAYGPPCISTCRGALKSVQSDCISSSSNPYLSDHNYHWSCLSWLSTLKSDANWNLKVQALQYNRTPNFLCSCPLLGLPWIYPPECCKDLAQILSLKFKFWYGALLYWPRKGMASFHTDYYFIHFVSSPFLWIIFYKRVFGIYEVSKAWFDQMLKFILSNLIKFRVKIHLQSKNQLIITKKSIFEAKPTY